MRIGKIAASLVSRESALAVALAVLLPPADGFAEALISVGVALAVAKGALANRSKWAALVLFATGGVLFAFGPSVWFAQQTLLVACIATTPRERTLAAAGRIVAFAALPIAMAILTLITLGTFGTICEVQRFTPVHADRWLVLTVAKALAIAAALRLRGTTARTGFALALAAGIAAIGIARIRYLYALARSPFELFWSETPFLANAVKLELGAPLYGDPRDVNSYSYSPLIDLVHRCVLQPFDANFSLFANRMLVVVCELGAAVILLLALRPWLRSKDELVGGEERREGKSLLASRLEIVAAGALLVFFAFSNLLAVTIHPDHLLLLLVAVVASILLRKELPTAALVALALLPPLATAVKLSGLGMAAALCAMAALERNRRFIGAAVASLALSLLTTPLFDHTLGAYSFYAIRLQSSHDRIYSRLLDASFQPFFAGMLALAGIAVVVTLTRAPRVRPSLPLQRVALLASALIAMSIPACVKVAGRENNLTLGLVLLVVVVIVAAREGKAARLPALFALFAIAFSIRPPVAAPDYRMIDSELGTALSRVRALRAEGKSVCAPATMLPDLARDPHVLPRNRLQSAVELDLGHREEANEMVRGLDACDYVFDLPGATEQRGLAIADHWNERLAKDFVEEPEQAPKSAPWFRWLRKAQTN